MFTTRIRLCLGLLFASVCSLTASAANPPTIPVTRPPQPAKVQPNRLGDVVYVLYYREAPEWKWYEWLVYSDRAGAEKDAKKFRDAGCETLIRTRPAN